MHSVRKIDLLGNIAVGAGKIADRASVAVKRQSAEAIR